MKTVDRLLGTRVSLSFVAGSDEQTTACEERALAEIEGFERVFSRFDETSELMRFRRTGHTAHPALRRVIGLADAWRRETSGAFHPGLQPLVDLWDAAVDTGEAPTEASVAAVVRQLQPLDPATLDLNGIAKGWIADTVLELVMADAGVSDGWMNLGGDVVHRGSGSLDVGIEDPRRPHDNVMPLARIELSNEALATSGGAHRWWRLDGVDHPKILDPRTGLPSQRVASASIVAPSAVDADVLATIAVFLDEREVLGIVEQHGADCLLVGHDGTLTTSSERFSRV